MTSAFTPHQVRVYVCMCVSVRVHASVCMREYVHTSNYLLYVRIYVCARICVYVCVCAYKQNYLMLFYSFGCLSLLTVGWCREARIQI